MNRPHPGLMIALGALAYPAGAIAGRLLFGYAMLHPDRPTTRKAPPNALPAARDHVAHRTRVHPR